MKFPVFGSNDDAPSTSATQYSYVNNSWVNAWTSTENQRQIPISENMTITDFKVMVDTAPGSGKTRVFTVRKNGADTGVTVTLSNTDTSAVFSGSVSFTAGDLLSLATTPTGTPTAPGNVYWHMLWNTTGSKYLVLGGAAATAPNSALNYCNPFGSSAYTITAGTQDVVVPTGGTLTKLTVASTDGAPGAGTSYACSMRLNNSSDVLTATISDANTSASATGSQALSAANTIQFKSNPSGTPTARRLGWCFTFEPTTDGESFYGYGSGAATPTAGTNYEQLTGLGNNAWTTTESSRLLKVPACDIKKLYVRLSAASGIGSDRAFTVRKNSAASALTVTLSNTTTGNNTADTVSLAADDTIGLQTVPNAVPPAACNTHIGYVLFTTQPATGNPAARLPLLGVG